MGRASGHTSKPALPKTSVTAKKSPASPVRKVSEPVSPGGGGEVKTAPVETGSPGGGTAPGAGTGTGAGGGSPKRASPKKSAGGGGGGGGKADIFSRLTDHTRYTGAHKARFDSDGRGRGLAGRDSVTKGGGTAIGSITGGATAARGAGSRGTNTKTGKMTCTTCGFSWSRPSSEAGRACPKCNNSV